MDYVTRQFINLAKKLRKELRAAVSSLDNGLKNQSKAIRESNDANKQRNDTQSILRAEFKIPQSERYKQETKDARESIIDHWKLYVEIVGILVIIAYTTVAAFQLREMHEALVAANRSASAAETANTNSQKQFQIEERPYVWLKTGFVGKSEFFANPSGGGQILWTFRYTNYGKSPAHEVFFSHRSMRVGIDGPFRESFGFPKLHQFTNPLAPSEENFVTILSQPGIRPEDYARYLKIDNAIQVRANIIYKDASGTQYESRICLGQLANGSIDFCDGNQIH
jgi:hypothetical protein